MAETIFVPDVGTVVRYMYPPCGGRAEFDYGAGHSYRCEDCGAVLGSIGQPRTCTDEAQKYLNWQKLGGKGWDYERGEEKV